MGPERSGRPTKLDVGEVIPEEIEAMAARLAAFAEPYQALLGVNAQRAHLGTFVGGLVGGIERKSVEPIALENGQERGPLQHFVGSSKWDESPLLARLRLEVSQEIGDPDAVLVVDGSAVPKKGQDSVGVTRQWCGRLGKVENCQVGVYLAYAASGSGVLVDRRLYLPRDWAKNKARRKKVHVPEDMKFKRAWELADEMLATSGSQLPHKWIVGDDEYGRPSAFRDRLAERSARYVLEVPSSTSVRKMRADSGRPPMWHTIKALVRRAPVDAWDCYQVRDGQKGPIQVRAIRIPVETRRPRADPRRETLLVMETLDGSDRWHFLTNASDEEPTSVLVRVAGQRHLIEEAFELGKGEAGLDHYEVRTWQGWHHHTACALLGGWFLVRESRRLGKKSALDDCEPGPVCVE
jgi:SRSO17 transposase